LDPAQAERLRADAAAAGLEAESIAAQIAILEVADEARARHVVHTAVTRDLGDRSAGELRARGIDVHDRSDHVTAEEWLAAHQAAQADDDQRTHIDEREVYDAQDADTRRDDDLLPAVDEHAGETDLPDIRETSTPDPGEHADRPRRSMRAPDETAAVLARAQEATTEITNRITADAARAAHDDPDATRRETLARWAHDDRTAEREAHDRGEELVRDR
ncbi:MAG: hypothetical protein H0X35_12200, partial [Pseudonocardiales bacterium]|nr:hypothetical protein [Pseudonocardiales bacterium]